MLAHPWPGENSSLVLPSGLVGVKNGKVPKEMLKRVDNSYLYPAAWNAWAALVIDCRQRLGISIWATDFYRSYEAQVQLKKDKPVGTAVPGTSNHGFGLAVDTLVMIPNRKYVSRAANGTSWQHDTKWAKFARNVSKFGWAFERGDIEERWHIRYIKGDVVPAAVTKFLNKFPPDVRDPATKKYGSLPFEGGKPVIKKGSTGLYVKYVQSVLKHSKIAPKLSVSGVFDDNTKDAVKVFQAFVKIDSDGIVGNQAWPAIDYTAIGLMK